jgi:YgiT-type zinc finger domain-containing protein
MVILEDLIANLQCPICGQVNTYEIKDIDVTYKVGIHTVTVSVRAGVCSICGEHAYDATASAKIDDAVAALRTGTLMHLHREGPRNVLRFSA